MCNSFVEFFFKNPEKPYKIFDRRRFAASTLHIVPLQAVTPVAEWLNRSCVLGLAFRFSTDLESETDALRNGQSGE